MLATTRCKPQARPIRNRQPVTFCSSLLPPHCVFYIAAAVIPPRRYAGQACPICCFRRRRPSQPNPTSAVPSTASEVGSGTGAAAKLRLPPPGLITPPLMPKSNTVVTPAAKPAGTGPLVPSAPHPPTTLVKQVTSVRLLVK